MPLTTPTHASQANAESSWQPPAGSAIAPTAGLAYASPAALWPGGSATAVSPQHITALDPSFPVVLRGLIPELWGRGAQSAWQALLKGPGAGQAQRVTIVGSRAASQSGLQRAFELGQALAAQGTIVLSGGALGIDGAAHQGALAAAGQSWAVLGSGLNSLYPRRHLPLFAELLERGLLLSPFPLPAPPRAGHFPKRNQVMAALADVVVVIEASLASGTRYTADAASRLGRRVLCFPGTAGTQALLLGGAVAVHSVGEAVAQLNALHESPDAPLLFNRPDCVAGAESSAVPSVDLTLLSEDSAHVLRLLGEPTASPAGCDVSELSARSELSAAACAAAVIELELHGCCSRLPGGRYIKRASL